MTIAESLAAFAPVLDRRWRPACGRAGTSRPRSAAPTTGRSHRPPWPGSAAELAALGCDEISIGDTIGVAGPDQVPQVVARSPSASPLDRIALHLHDTGGRALDNVAAGLEVGVRTFDSSAAGLGGCPFAPGAPGNVATEALVRFLHRQGMETGVDPDAVERAGRGVRDRLAA